MSQPGFVGDVVDVAGMVPTDRTQASAGSDLTSFFKTRTTVGPEGSGER